MSVRDDTAELEELKQQHAAIQQRIASLSGADVAGADFTEADLEGTVLRGVKGFEAARGMDRALNGDKAVR